MEPWCLRAQGALCTWYVLLLPMFLHAESSTGCCEHKLTPPPAASAVVFQQLADAGVAVYCFDVHGHGESEPKEPQYRGLIRSYKHLVRIQACNLWSLLPCAAAATNSLAFLQHCCASAVQTVSAMHAVRGRSAAADVPYSQPDLLGNTSPGEI